MTQNMTEGDYLKDTYLFEGKSSIMEIGENEFGKFIILPNTIFYPQGGGQPSDIGEIKSGEKVFFVEKVRLNEEGTIYHYGKSDDNFGMGEEITMSIDKENRLFNARNHSAGHLIDLGVKKLGFLKLIPTKGHHFKEGSYVEYEGDFKENPEDFINALNEILKELIASNIKVIVSYEDIGNIHAPVGKIPRYVNFEGEKGCGCGGTHVRSIGEIGAISIRKIKYKGNILKISYEIQ